MTRTRIKPVSKKRQKSLRIYTTLRKQYLQQHELCEAQLNQCSQTATDIHHKAGRIGDQLNDTSDWLAVCRSCHTWIELHPKEAKELEFSKSRIS